LTRLNRELAGNLKSGFVTCICARLDGGGLVTIANAGHLSGWINADEIATPGMLPLGVTDAGVQYPTEQIQLKIGDTLTFLSDGVVEARCESEGALFGFERLQQLLTERPPNAAKAAPGFDLVKFSKAFAPIAAELQMHWQIGVMNLPTRVALFCSQYLHCVADLLQRWQSRELSCDLRVIVSNHRDAEKIAAYYGIPFEYLPVHPNTRAEAEAQQLEILEQHKIELVILARYMQILSPAFVAKYPAAIIYVHHSFLPAFIGARPYHAAHARGVKLIGATSHYVTEVLDDGPIIEQDVARISHRDEVDDLIARGRDLERLVLARAVKWHLDRRILCYGNKTVVFD
jgi:formyltetrahydrofolate deformylase